VRALRALRVKGFEPDCAVVALGTNDVMISADPNRYTAWIGEMLDELGEIPVLWVNVAFQKQVARARAFNEVLVAMQATRPRLAVADWFTAAEPHPEWLGPDRLHLRRAGYQYRGTWLASLILDELYGVAPVDDAPDCTITVRLRLGTMHDDVVCLETRLEQFGFEVAGGPDRRFDVTTYRAVARFQSRHWMAPNGIVGPGTVVALGLEG